MILADLSLFLAQNANTSAAPAGLSSIFQNPMFALFLVMAVFFVVLIRGDSKRKKQAQNMLKNIKKNDRVLTIGGMVGTVVSTKENEIVVRVDESTNTKITFVRSAIQRVLPEEPEKTS